MADFHEHLLVPTDFGEAAWTAFRRACDLGRPLAARLTLLHVKQCPAANLDGLSAIRRLHGILRAPPQKDGVTPTLWNKMHNDPAHQQLRDIADSDWSLGVEVNTLLTEGDIAAEILRIASEIPASLIVMGARGRTRTFGRRDYTTDKVLIDSTRPVMLVPRHQQKSPVIHLTE